MESKPKFLDGKVGFVLVAGGIAVLFIGVAFLGFYFGGAFDQSSCPAGDATVGAATAERCAEDCVLYSHNSVEALKRYCTDLPNLSERHAAKCDDPEWLDETVYAPLYFSGSADLRPDCLCRDQEAEYVPLWSRRW
jgi:hypothetical protein